jgi:tetratricopeptide (TPR) repeat protein
MVGRIINMHTVMLVRIITFAILLLTVPHGHAEASIKEALLHLRQGTAALLRSDYEAAISSYNKIKAEKAELGKQKIAHMLNGRGLAQWKTGRLHQAAADFERAIKNTPNDPLLYNNLGNLLLQMGEHKKAARNFNKAIRIAPQYGAAYNNRGNLRYALKNIKGAIEDYTRAINLMKTSAVPFNGRGKAYNLVGMPYAAIRDLNRSISISRKYKEAVEKRARIYAATRQYNKAIADYSTAIELSPEKERLYIKRARLYLKKHKFIAAIKDFNYAITKQPNLAGLYSGRALAYANIGSNKSALRSLDTALEISFEGPQVLQDQALIYLRMKRLDDAFLAADEVIENLPEQAALYAIRAKILKASKKYARAINDYNRALELEPFNPEYRDELVKLGGPVPALSGVSQKLGDEGAEGWQMWNSGGKFFASNQEDYPGLHIPLETLAKTPRLVAWEKSKEQKGFGILRYTTSPTNEYAAIVNTKTKRMLAIEPYMEGGRKTNWEWGRYALLVTDKNNIISEVRLRTPPEEISDDTKKAHSEVVNNASENSALFWLDQILKPLGALQQAAPPAKTAKGRKRNKSRRKEQIPRGLQLLFR